MLHFKRRLDVSMGKVKIQMKGNTEWNNGDGGTQWQASKKRLMFLQFRIFSPPSSRLSFFSTLSLLPLPPSFHSPARYRAFLSLFHSFLRSLHTYHGFLPFSLSLPTPRHLHHYSRQPYPSFLSSSPFLSPIITTLTFVISLRLPLRFLSFFFLFLFFSLTIVPPLCRHSVDSTKGNPLSIQEHLRCKVTSDFQTDGKIFVLEPSCLFRVKKYPQF